MQIDLLRVLEERKICRIGSSQSLDVDFRLISATRRDLEEAIDRGTFRRDFFYRVNVISIRIPPLRERKNDIPLLIEHFLEKYSHETTKHVDHITPEAQTLLLDYDWPGNVRELENVIERAVVLSKSRTLEKKDFAFLQPMSLPEPSQRSLKAREKAYIQAVLLETDWNVTKAAAILDINRVTLHKKIKRYQLVRQQGHIKR
jgi:two-component system response regulator HydG